MSRPPKILAFAGSLRKDSFNKKLLRIVVHGARNAGAEVTCVELNDYPMPIFDQDFEATSGPPDTVKALKAMMIAHDGFLIASPEYNSSVTAVLKNTIDWVSRPERDKPATFAFQRKAAAIMSASPSGLGGLRGLVHLRSILSNIGVIVWPDQVAVSEAQQAFDADGNLINSKRQQAAENLGADLTKLLSKWIA